MAPQRKDPKKEAPPPPKVTSLYKKREPLPAKGPPDPDVLEQVVRASRVELPPLLPLWDEEAVKATPWNPKAETPYTNTTFDARALPRSVLQHVTGWKRAALITDEEVPLEHEPVVVAVAPTPEPEQPSAPSPEQPQPKAKAESKGKAEGKAKAKGEPKAKSKPPPVEQKPPSVNVAELFGERSSEFFVVSQTEFRSRQFELTDDDSMSPLCQSIASQIAVIGEQRKFIPKGHFLWELIHPQDEQGHPFYNPNGKYVVKLFVEGSWRQVLIDDIVPVGTATVNGLLAPIFPATHNANVLWPQLLTKALVRAYQADLSLPSMNVISALTGLLPFQLPVTWENLEGCFQTRPFSCIQMMSEINVAARKKEAVPSVEAGHQGARRAADPVDVVVGLAQETIQTQKLASPPGVSLLNFLLCELEGEPRQMRMKALSWLPRGGALRKTVPETSESEIDDEDEEDPQKLDDRSFTETLVDDEDDDDEIRSPGEDRQDSARRDKDSEADGGDGDKSVIDPTSAEFVPPWPPAYQESAVVRSALAEFRGELTGGYWVNFENWLAEAAEGAAGTEKQKLIAFASRNDVMHTMYNCLLPDPVGSSGDVGRGGATPQPDHQPAHRRELSLLRLQLTAKAFDESKSLTMSGVIAEVVDKHNDVEDHPDKVTLGPVWHKVALHYEPVAALVPNHQGPRQKDFSCRFGCVSDWQPGSTVKPEEPPPETIELTVEEGSSPATTQTLLLQSGEHWYLTFDDAPASCLSVQVDDTVLDRELSLVAFEDPMQVLRDHGMPEASLEGLEYAPQQGFGVWAKAELTVSADAVLSVSSLRLLSEISDPRLRQHLQLSFIQVTDPGTSGDPDNHGSPSLVTLYTTPFDPVITLPLGRADDEGQAAVNGPQSQTYILLLCASLPSLIPPGTLSIHAVMLNALELSPPVSPAMPSIKESVPARSGEVALEEPLHLSLIDTTHVMRWSAATATNEKNIVLRERLTIPIAEGAASAADTADVIASVRVTVSGLPRAFLRATLIAQLMPATNASHDATTEQTPGAAEAGKAHLPEPKQYGGRFKWLERCQQIEEQTGVAVAFFPHVVLRQHSIYILDVRVDPYRGPAKLDGGEWQLEIFGSGEIESGADTMEQDLEDLVRQSWEESQDPNLPPRKERAATSRKKWLIQQGLMDPEPVEEVTAPPAPAPKAAAKAKAEPAAPPKKGKDAKEPPPEPEETPEEIQAREKAELEAAQKRAESIPHCNGPLCDFLVGHTAATEAVLVAEDCYTILPAQA